MYAVRVPAYPVAVLKLRADSLTWQAVDDELVVLDLTASRYLSINAAGAVLWPQLVEGSTHDDLVRLLVDIFEISEADAERDVTAFIATLEGRSLLEPH